MNHPDIDKMNRDGFLGAVEYVDQCDKCEKALRRGEKVVEFSGRTFCDDECLTESFSDNPASFGAETIEL